MTGTGTQQAATGLHRPSACSSRLAYRKNFQYERPWGGRMYAIKQVLAIVAEEMDSLVVVTVYTFYF